MTWQLLVAIGVVTLSINIILRRMLLRDSKLDPFAFAAVFQGLTGICILLFALSQGFVLPDVGQYWLWMLVTVALYACGAIVSAHVLKLVEASVFSLLFATSAAWTMLAQFFIFHTTLTGLQLLGAVLLLVSIMLLVERSHIKANKGIALGIVMGIVYGFANVGWAHVAKNSDVASWNAISFLLPAILILFIRPKSIPAIGGFFKAKLFKQMLLIGAVFAISSLATLYAFKYGNVSIVAVLLQTSIVTTMLLGVFVLNEKKQLRRKAVAVATCLLAVLLIV